jgi:hypothetical protein
MSWPENRDTGVTLACRYGIVGGLNPKGIHMRHLITIGCLVAAIILYATGDKSTAGLLLLGAVFEGVFWFRLVRGRRPQ